MLLLFSAQLRSQEKVHANAEAASVLSFIGEAYALDSEKLLYTEEHRIARDATGAYLTSRVRYRAPQGQLIADKKLDFRANVLMPNLNFTDLRNGSLLNVHLGKSLLLEKVSGNLAEQANGGQAEQKLSQERIAIDDSDGPVVVDAGFDQLVLQYWQQLLAGESLAFDFLALSRGSLVGFELAKVSEDQRSVVLEIKARSWVISLLLEPIRLTYAKADGRLLEYRGVTNIAQAQDGKVLEDNYNARIRYRYLKPSGTKQAAEPLQLKESP